MVDEIRLRVPSEWTGPYQVDPPMTLTQLDNPDAKRLLILRPAAAVTDRLHFSVSSPLSGEPIRVPDISLRQAKTRMRLVILPTRAENKRLRWETQRLKKTDLPKDFPASAVAYEVAGDTFQAVLAPEDQLEGVSKVHLSDVRIAWRTDGTCHGGGELRPSTRDGRARCPLSLPKGYRLIQLSVAGVPTAPIPRADAIDQEKSDEHH